MSHLLLIPLNRLQWQWSESSSHLIKQSATKWNLFDEKCQRILNQFVTNNTINKVQYEINGIKYETYINQITNRVIQQNLQTSFERNVRLCIKSLSSNSDDINNKVEDKSDGFTICTWQWLDDSNNWSPYLPTIVMQLEHFYEQFIHNPNNYLFNLVLQTNTYTIDLKNMNQINTKTGFMRKVKRAVSDVTNIAESQNDEKMTQAKASNDQAIEDRPSSNLRKRKNTATNDLSIRASASIENKNDIESEEEVENKKPKRKASTSKANTKKQKENDDDTDEIKVKLELKQEPNDEPDDSTTKTRKKTTRKTSVNYEENEEVDLVDEKIEVKEEIKEEQIKTIKYTGQVPLDEKFSELIGHEYRIYREGDTIYDCMLNQLIEQAKSKNYLVWMRWGRVGKNGQHSLDKCGSDLNRAKDIFCKKFFDKTRNDWPLQDTFEKYPGKYDLVEKDYELEEDFAEKEKEKKQQEVVKVDIPESKLDKKVQDLIELICNVSEMENILKEMKYDAKRAPLGKLSKNQLKAGFAALKKMEDLIKRGSLGKELVEANNEFYTRIPHDFGMRKPPIINTNVQLREKLKLLEVLSDIEVAVETLNQKSDIENPIDRHYDQLNCTLKPIDHSDSIFKLINDYLQKTHAPTHSNYKLKLLDVFEARKESEIANFKDLGNRMLLWHGSRLTNWASILSQGLRIAPPEAPVTGYMFGKGCYFADCSSKSANYCYTTSTRNIGVLSLSEVSLGKLNELKQADYNADKLPANKSSTKGVGKSEPDRKEWVTLDDGCIVPVGKIKQAIDSKEAINYSLLYNEYVVYDVSQIKLKYLVKIQFDYDDEEDED